MKKTFVEKVLGAPAGAIVFKKPDLVLTHDNTASIFKTFEKMDGSKVANPEQLLIVLDHNAPPTSAKLATQYQSIRDIVADQGVDKFYDAGRGICHQIMSYHARPGMIIVGSDSHTCTAGAFNAFAAGIDRTESAGIWKKGETWFRVPESIKITLNGQLPQGVFAKDLSLYIIGLIGSAGANYLSIEFHGDGVAGLNMSQRMTLANLASEMGAKNAVFPPDQILEEYFSDPVNPIWADPDATYFKEININLSELYPLVAAPHHVDNVKSLADVAGTQVQQGLIGTCTNGRIEDIREAAEVIRGKQIKPGFQLLVIPASREIYLQAMKEGLVEDLLSAGANFLSSSCGPCLGTGQGIPADGITVISTANRNFKGRMGNPNSSIYLASPATVAGSALTGMSTDPRDKPGKEMFRTERAESQTPEINADEDRYANAVWDYSDQHNVNTDQMFAGNMTYNVLSSDGEAIMPYLFAGFDPTFSGRVQSGDILIAGDNFGCGSSREHPAVGLAHAGVQAVIAKSVNRIFYRSAINQGLTLIVHPEAVDAFNSGDTLEIKFEEGEILVAGKKYSFEPLPDKLMDIIRKKGLVNWIKSSD